MSATKTPSILFVEDEDKVWNAWFRPFSRLDPKLFNSDIGEMRVDRARSQDEANEAMERAVRSGNPYKLVFLDLRYPEHSWEELIDDDDDYTGLRYLDRFRETLPNAVIIVFSAFADHKELDLAREALEKGANDVLPKVNDIHLIEFRVANAVRNFDKIRAHQQLQREATYLLRSHWSRVHLSTALRAVEQHIAVLSNLASDARWLGADGHDLQEAIVRAGDSLRDRVNQVSNDPRKMSKLEETPNFGQWLKENLAWVDLIFAEHQIRLKWPADAVPLRSYLADLSVVMHELLQNALCGIVAKGEQPDRRICVSITQADPQTVKVVVEDNGCGIMSSVLESGEIFKAEYTAWPPEVSKLLKIEHKGLGLNFVRQIINQIGGRIRVENVGGEEGSGLRVELSVPSIESTALPPGNAV